MAKNFQAELLPFLLNPRSYPHQPRTVQLVQTHSSLVFLAPPFVYKLKKPVDFGFLDFSTLERRKHFCGREVELNRRLSPQVYLGVVPICRTSAGFRLGEPGEVVEYAVKMRLLPKRYFFDRLLKSRAVNPRLLDGLAQTLAQFYLSQRPTPEIERWGFVDRLKISTNENFRQARPFTGNTLSRAAFATIREYTDRFYRRHAALFAARVREKWIRDCHGDLHLEHIHLAPRGLHIYDCIEFNDRFRYVDVASDIAFLAMDLDYEGRPDLARYFVVQMAKRLRDPGMLHLMNFYKCYRAFVRGKVETLHSLAQTAPKAEREASAERARCYFRLALHYAVSRPQPLVLAVMGRIASGKSTLARALAGALGWRVYSSDQVRKELARVPIHARGTGPARASLYSGAMTQKTYGKLFALARAEVRAGRSVILDATFGQKRQRDRLRRGFTTRSAVVHFIELQAANELVRRRLRQRDSSTDEVSDARLEDFEKLARRYEPPRELPEDQVTLTQTSSSPEAALAAALKALLRR